MRAHYQSPYKYSTPSVSSSDLVVFAYHRFDVNIAASNAALFVLSLSAVRLDTMSGAYEILRFYTTSCSQYLPLCTNVDVFYLFCSSLTN